MVKEKWKACSDCPTFMPYYVSPYAIEGFCRDRIRAGLFPDSTPPCRNQAAGIIWKRVDVGGPTPGRQTMIAAAGGEEFLKGDALVVVKEIGGGWAIYHRPAMTEKELMGQLDRLGFWFLMAGVTRDRPGREMAGRQGGEHD